MLQLTGSPAALGLVTVAQALPVTILTLFSGVLIDRMQTRKLMLATQVVLLLQAAVLAVLTLSGQVQFWHVLTLAAVLGVASAVDFPARSVIVSELVEPPLVGNGIALNSALNSGARIIGPGVGGLMIAVWGNGVCFAVTSLAYVASIVGLALLSSEDFYPKRLAPKSALFRQLAEGVRYSFSTPSLAVNMVLAGFYGTFAYNWALVLPLMARFALDIGAEGFGALNVAMGIGSTIGAFALATRVKTSMRLLLISAAVFAASIMVLAQAPNIGVALAMLVVTGAADQRDVVPGRPGPGGHLPVPEPIAWSGGQVKNRPAARCWRVARHAILCVPALWTPTRPSHAHKRATAVRWRS